MLKLLASSYKYIQRYEKFNKYQVIFIIIRHKALFHR